MTEIRAEYTLAGVRRLLQQLLDSAGISEFELARRASLNPATIYNVRNEKTSLKNETSQGMRRQSLRKIGESLGYKVTFNAEEKEIILIPVHDAVKGTDELEDFWRELRDVFQQAGKLKLTPEERTRLKEVIRAIIT